MSEELNKPPPLLSVAILAGGESRRMGKDKAFLTYRGKRFIETIAQVALKVSDDVMVVIGSKQEGEFRWLASLKNQEEGGVSISLLSDEYRLKNPVGGILTAAQHARHEYMTVLPCDSPLVSPGVIKFLRVHAENHSGAVPVWENGDTEPLCAVYRTSEIGEAIKKALAQNKLGPKHAISFLQDVRFVPVEELRRFDSSLESFRNVNTIEDFESLP